MVQECDSVGHVSISIGETSNAYPQVDALQLSGFKFDLYFSTKDFRNMFLLDAIFLNSL